MKRIAKCELYFCRDRMETALLAQHTCKILMHSITFFTAVVVEDGDALLVRSMCEKLESSITAETYGHYEETALIVASRLGHVDVVDVLLEVNYSSEAHITATDK